LRSRRPNRWVSPHLSRKDDFVGVDRPLDVLEALFAGIVYAELHLPWELFVNSSGHEHAAGLRNLLQPRGDVDAVADQVVAIDNDIAEMDADAKNDGFLGGSVELRPFELLLDRRSTIHRLDYRRELDQHAVAHQLDCAPAMLGDQRFDDLLASCFQGGKGPDLVGFHHAREADDVGGQNSRYLSLYVRPRHSPPPEASH
jgi:hypothetical protein